MDGRASQSIAGTHLNAWPSPVTLLKFTSLFFSCSSLNPFLPYFVRCLVLAALFSSPVDVEFEDWACFLSDKLRFIVPSRIAQDLAHFPLSLIAASAAHSFDFHFLDLRSGLSFIDIAFALRAVY